MSEENKELNERIYKAACVHMGMNDICKVLQQMIDCVCQKYYEVENPLVRNLLYADLQMTLFCWINFEESPSYSNDESDETPEESPTGSDELN